MKLTTYPATAALQPFVRHFLVVESEKALENRLLPDTSIVLAFRFQGDVAHTENGRTHRLPPSVITGLRKSSRVVSYAPQSAVLLVVFRDDGAAAFFREPLHELFEASEPLAQLIRRQELAEVEEQVAEAKHHELRIARVERFLLARLSPRPAHSLIHRATREIRRRNGNVRIRALAAALNLSLDPFEKQFRRAIGASPKQFATILRFRSLLGAGPADRALTGLAHAAGYFDQAHFIKDFRAFTGQAPRDFFQSAVYW